MSASMTIWNTFVARRREYLRLLARSIEPAVTRRETPHPVFSGCIDWHSCVHGIYALLECSRLLGDTHWQRVAECRLHKHLINEELKNVATRLLVCEIPYGYAWLLKLAVVRECHTARKDLRPLGVEVAKQLRVWLIELNDNEVQRLARSQEYGNVSWALLNLWEWSQWLDDEELAEELRIFTSRRLLPVTAKESGFSVSNVRGFFSPELQAMRAISSILPAEHKQTQVDRYIDETLVLAPVTEPKTIYSAGLNFSRSWGFWNLFKITGNLRYRDMYVDHIVTQMNLPEYWRYNYHKYGHWIPQFGVYAIALSMESI